MSAATPAWNGLAAPESTLPSAWYFDPAHYWTELEKIWYRDWIYLCRADALAGPLAFRTFAIGTQNILVLRDEAGTLRAFHNTCRHRGSALCQEPEGKLRARFLTCPYHSWTYGLDGALLRVPPAGRTPPFDLADHPLYDVALALWNGCVFVNLADDPAPFGGNFDLGAGVLDHWRMADLVTGHRFRKVMRCNWKIFWENYNECLHCPRVHPELCSVVPIYGRSIMEERDDPDWASREPTSDPRHKGGLRTGAVTWSMDGRSNGFDLPGLTEAERAAGYLFVTSYPAMYVVAHVDYVRIVRLLPLGPEETELTAEWLFRPDAIGTDLRNTTDFATLVMGQDAGVCEINQQGLRSIRHTKGVLMPEEYAIHQFHGWVRSALAR